MEPQFVIVQEDRMEVFATEEDMLHYISQWYYYEQDKEQFELPLVFEITGFEPHALSLQYFKDRYARENAERIAHNRQEELREIECLKSRLQELQQKLGVT